MQKKMIVVLDTVRSAHNVGAIFRTCEGAGVEAIWLVEYTPTPIDRFGREQPEIQKTSLGAAALVSWQQYSQAAVLAELRAHQERGYTVVAVEQTPSAVALPSWQAPEKVIYVFGNEIDGVSEALLAAADKHIAIPMHGQKESLNVSVAAGIILYH